MKSIFLVLFSILLIGCNSTQEKSIKEERPNILILFLDDLDPDFGCYGNTLVTTPNIDKLASEGMLFTRAYSAATVCSPSHTTLFTGCYASTIGAPHHRSSYIDKLPDGYSILTELMDNAGYFTVNFRSKGDLMYQKLYGATAKTDLNFDRGKPENNRESGKEVFKYLQTIDPENIETYFKGGKWNSKERNQPFFAYANIETGKKHGFVPGRKWAKERGIEVDSTKIKIPPHYSDTGEVRRVLASSLDAVSHVDFEVGKFLKALEKSGYANNTLVILMSDHGATLQRHKQSLWTSGIHIPMIIKWPNKIKSSEINEELASIIDIAPTFLNAAGIEIPKTMEGLDLLSDKPKNRKYIFATRDGMNNFFDCSRAVISKEYQYIHHFFPELSFRGNGYAKRTLTFKSMLELYKKDSLNELQRAYFEPSKNYAVELYNLNNDTEETVNLALNSAYKEKTLKYQHILFQWQKETGDKVLKARELLNVKKVPEGTKVDNLLKLTNE
ncbi:sulfatase [uncultured Lutibacter sp.]|uniref:sulfatase family protein n=1 Tax=uncultured Lutibacter sp. TaxID=437739 RepID=UPI002610B7F5|nr:sulfatase [uncultured Lutibacter sp.]